MSSNQLSYYPESFLAPVNTNGTYGFSGPSAPMSGRRVALNSASGGVGQLPIFTTLLAAPINVVSTTIDTRGIGTSNNLLHFTSIISLPINANVTLNFQVHRSSNGGQPIAVGGTYTFAATVSALESESFSFQFFDPDVLPSFNTYSVEISTNSIIDVAPGVTVNNAVLSVLAVSNR